MIEVQATFRYDKISGNCQCSQEIVDCIITQLRERDLSSGQNLGHRSSYVPNQYATG